MKGRERKHEDGYAKWVSDKTERNRGYRLMEPAS